MTDKNGTTLKVGDTVTLTCTVKAILDQSDACDIRLSTAENMPCSNAPQNLLTNHLCIEKVVETASVPVPAASAKPANAAVPASAPGTPAPTI